MVRIIAAVAAVLLIAAAGGCGSSDSGPLTQAEYTKQAKVICHDGEREKEEAISAAVLRFQEGEKEATPKMQEKAVLEVLKPYERTTAKLAELEAPANIAKEVKTMLQRREEAPKIMRADPEKALRDSSPIIKGMKASEALGLGRCDF